MTRVLQQFANEWTLISQAPLTLIVVCLLALLLAYAVVRWQTQKKLREADTLIGSYRSRLHLNPSDGSALPYEDQVSKLTAENEHLRAKLRPILEVFFGEEPPFIQTTEHTEPKVTVTHYGVQIHNSGGETAHRVRVEVEGFREWGGAMRTTKYWEPTPRLQEELSLDPGETETLLLLRTEPDRGPFLIIPPFMEAVPLASGQHDLTFRVYARDLPSQEVKASLDVQNRGHARLTRALIAGHHGKLH